MNKQKPPKHASNHHHTWWRWINPRTLTEVGQCSTCRLNNIGNQWSRYDPPPLPGQRSIDTQHPRNPEWNAEWNGTP